MSEPTTPATRVPAGDLSARVAAVRAAFDEGFQAPRRVAGRSNEVELLLLRAGGRRLAVRLSQVAGLEGGKQGARVVVPLPGAAPGRLGLTAVRGQLVAVWGLGRLLGEAGGEPDEARWLLRCGPDGAAGLAFAAFEGHASVAPERLARASEPGVEAVVTVGDGPRGVVSIPALLARLPMAERGIA